MCLVFANDFIEYVCSYTVITAALMMLGCNKLHDSKNM